MFMAEIQTKSKRGGARVGAGRPRKDATNFNAYEGANRYSQQRMMIYSPSLDAQKELTSGSRIELIRKANWLVNNIGLAGRIVEGIARLVGPLIPQARTADDKWNRKAEQKFEDACGNAAFGVDVAGFVNFYQAQNLLVTQMAVGGDLFWQKMLSSNGRGMFRLIPGENVGGGESAKGWVDGVRLSPLGKPEFFRVQKSPLSKDFVEVSAYDLTQVRRAYRLGYTRAPSWLARAANHMQDISETLGYEKMSAKLGASLAFVIESPEAGNVGLGSRIVKQNAGTDKEITVDEMIGGSTIPHIKPGEKITSFNNLHPNQNLETFFNYLVRDIAYGVGVSPEFLWNITSAGGANTRWVLEDAAVFIREIQDIIIQSFAAPFWRFWIWQEIQAGRLEMPNDGEDWWRCDFTPPQRVSVDFGRDGRLMSDLLLRGQISPQRYYALQGLDADKQDEDTIRFAARRKKLIAQISQEEGVELTVADVFPPAPGSPVQPQEPDADEETPPKKKGKDLTPDENANE